MTDGRCRNFHMKTNTTKLDQAQTFVGQAAAANVIKPICTGRHCAMTLLMLLRSGAEGQAASAERAA
eukprot:969665-Pleurochrysis_carterae.AAC.3